MFCDTASLTSVTLLKVLLAEHGLKPEFKPLESYAVAKDKDFVLLIGDPALDVSFANEQQPTHEIFDLGTAWRTLTAAAGLAGDIELARRGLTECRRLQPNVSIAWVDKYYPLIRTEDRARYIEGLRRAGLE